MAIGTLIPTIRACTADRCTVIKVYDTTDEYDVTSNEGGWGVTNTLPTTITAATLTYTPPGGSATDVDVLELVNAVDPVTGEFLIAEITLDAADGEYEFTYSLSVDDATVTASLTIFSLCVVRCCVDKLWAKAAKEQAITNCDCTLTSTSYSTRALQAEALYKAISNAVSCGSETTRDTLLLKLQRICNLENCNCS